MINPKFEYRNPRQIQMTKAQNPKQVNDKNKEYRMLDKGCWMVDAGCWILK